jgi:hypothetical protein
VQHRNLQSDSDDSVNTAATLRGVFSRSEVADRSRRDAQDKAAIIPELLERLGARPDEAIEEGYVEL